MRNARFVIFGAIVVTMLVGVFVDASAERFTGGSYTIDASVVGNSFGGATTGGSYQLTSSGGESVIGQGSGGSYKLDSGYVAQLQSSLQLAIQPANLGAYYPLDEPSGTRVYDASANAQNGDTQGTPSFTTGQIGGAYDFSGDDSITIPTSSQQDLTGNFTVSAWINMDGNDGEAFPNILQKEVGGTDRNYTVYVGGTTGHFSGSSSFSGVGSTAASTTDVMDGTWHYVVYRVDGVNLSAFVDGAQEGTATASGTIDTAPGTPLYIAQGTRWDGRIDEIKLFSRALSDNEIKAEYDAGVAGHASGLSFATSIVPGISQTSGYDAIVHTDASNYNLAVSQNQNLTKGGDTIAAVSGSIGTPVSWVEATTKGLGFTLYGTNATAIPGKWSSGNAYAAFPGSATSYYLRSGTQSTKDVLNMRLRLDVPTSQVSGTYTNTITTTGTITP